MQDRWDKTLLTAVGFLLAVGILMVFSASSYRALEDFGSSTYYLRLHLAKVLVAVVGGLICFKLGHERLVKISPFVLLAAFGMLIYVLAAGPVIKGSRRWILLPFFRIEVSDVAKLALVLFFARTLPTMRERLRDFRHGLAPQLLIAGMMSFLIAKQPDKGTAAILFCLALLILFVAGARFTHLVLVFTIALTLAATDTLRKDYQRKRVVEYVKALKGEEVPYHAEQAVIGLGMGGLTGVGLGQSKQKLYYLPEPFTDSIFAILGEEIGFLGTAAVLVAYLIIVLRGLRIAVLAPTLEARLLATGLTGMVGLYALLNIAVITGLVPATGIPLPFVSYGGSSLVANLVAVGLLVDISRRCDVSYARYPSREHYNARLRKRKPRPSPAAAAVAHSKGEDRRRRKLAVHARGVAF